MLYYICGAILRVSLGKTFVDKLFKGFVIAEQFGVSPYAYLINQRIEHAKRLLKNSDSSITDIAFDCGFNSSSQFTNIFKKYVLLTPKEYQNKN
jgi:AraC family transcriptional regulator